MITLSNIGLSRIFAGKSTTRPTLQTLLAVAKERHILKNLSKERLNDIGYSEGEVNLEANRPLWDVPSHWRR